MIVSIQDEATGNIYYEEAKAKGLHQLTLHSSKKDSLEIGVIYKNRDCIKKTTASFKCKHILTVDM